MSVPNGRDLLAIAPQLIISGFAMMVLLADAIWTKISKRFLANFSILGLAIAAIVMIAKWPKADVQPAMQGMVTADGYTAFFTLVFALGTALSIWLSYHSLERDGGNHGEYYALMLFTATGAIVMAAAVNLIVIFIGLEILSISLYILAGYRTEKFESDEAALKYFLLGAFASAFLLYGIALVYGATGSISLAEISHTLSGVSESGVEHGKNFLLLGGIAMMLVGFGFKVAVVPFHIWTPDVYEGAPTGVTAFMSVAAKAAGFAAFLRVISSGFSDSGVQLQISAVLASIAALTMLVGNVVAVVQTGIKRMLAYSSIAHAGYILVGLVAAVRPGAIAGTGNGKSDAIAAVLFYMLTYTVTNLGAFGVVMALRKKGEEIREIKDFAGLGYKYPVLGIVMSLCLLSLAGLPPTAGFFGKLLLLQALVGMNTPLVWLIVLFVLTSAVSFYYYLGVVRALYMDRASTDPSEAVSVSADWQLRLALVLCAVGVIVLGLWAKGALDVAQSVAQGFGGSGPLNALR